MRARRLRLVVGVAADLRCANGPHANYGGAHGRCILVETLVLAGTAADNGTAGGTLNQPVEA